MLLDGARALEVADYSTRGARATSWEICRAFRKERGPSDAAAAHTTAAAARGHNRWAVAGCCRCFGRTRHRIDPTGAPMRVSAVPLAVWAIDCCSRFPVEVAWLMGEMELLDEMFFQRFARWKKSLR